MNMTHATAMIWAVHNDRALISSIVDVEHDGLLPGKLATQLIHYCLYVKYTTQVAVAGNGSVIIEQCDP